MMEEGPIWCVKCRTKTETVETDYRMSKNRRPMVTGKCQACGTKKQQFITLAAVPPGIQFVEQPEEEEEEEK